MVARTKASPTLHCRRTQVQFNKQYIWIFAIFVARFRGWKSCMVCERSGTPVVIPNANLADPWSEALNGQLPNQDVMNAAIDNARFEGIPIRLANRGQSDADINSVGKDYAANARALLHATLHSISGIPSLVHAVFTRWIIVPDFNWSPPYVDASIRLKVDSITIRPVSSSESSLRFDICSLGQ